MFDPSLLVIPKHELRPLAEVEKEYVLFVLNRFDGNRTHAAKALGIGSNTLWRKLKKWGVPPARPRRFPDKPYPWR